LIEFHLRLGRHSARPSVFIYTRCKFRILHIFSHALRQQVMSQQVLATLIFASMLIWVLWNTWSWSLWYLASNDDIWVTWINFVHVYDFVYFQFDFIISSCWFLNLVNFELLVKQVLWWDCVISIVWFAWADWGRRIGAWIYFGRLHLRHVWRLLDDCVIELDTLLFEGLLLFHIFFIILAWCFLEEIFSFILVSIIIILQNLVCALTLSDVIRNNWFFQLRVITFKTDVLTRGELLGCLIRPLLLRRQRFRVQLVRELLGVAGHDQLPRQLSHGLLKLLFVGMSPTLGLRLSLEVALLLVLAPTILYSSGAFWLPSVAELAPALLQPSMVDQAWILLLVLGLGGTRL